MLLTWKNVLISEEAREDFNLIVTNCKTYNEEGSEIYEVCLKIYIFKFRSLANKFEDQNH